MAKSASKDEGREAFRDLLISALNRVVDFLRFAETKNAALLTFASAWVFGSINLLTSERAPAGIINRALWVALVLFVVAAVVAMVSFLPKLRLQKLHRDPSAGKNLLYFSDIAEFDAAGFFTRVRERYLGTGDQAVTDAYVEDLAIQISANSKITHRKFRLFNVGAALVLLALLALALAVTSAWIHHTTAGAAGWA